jgi:predicted PurR-regulated permease PerM
VRRTTRIGEAGPWRIGDGSATTVAFMADDGVLAERDRMPRWVPQAIGLFFVGAATLSTSRWLLRELHGLLIILLVSLFLSFALEPAVNRLERMGIRRGAGTGLVFLATLGASGIFIFAIGTLLADQVTELVDQAPGYITDIEQWVEETFNVEVQTDELVSEFQADGAATSFATRLAGNLVDLGSQIVGLLFSILTIGLFTFYLVADGPRIREVICGLLRPKHQRRVLGIWDLAIDKTGGYIYSRAILAVLSAAVHWAAFAAIGVPFPLPLALWMGLVSQFIPVVGTYIAGAFPLLVALLDSPSKALAVLILILIYQQIENYFFAPKITAQTMEIHVAVAFGAVIAGSAVLGPVGALVALPAAATIQAFASSIVSHYDVVDEVRSGGLPPRRLAD